MSSSPTFVASTLSLPVGRTIPPPETLVGSISLRRAMAGRGRSAHILPLHDPPPSLLARVPPPAPLLRAADDALVARRHAVIALEERLAAQLREIRILLNDNEELAGSHVALKRDLDASQHELRIVAASAAESKAKADAEAREIFERSCKAESEVRLIERMRADMAQVESDVRTFSAEKEELTQKLQSLKGDLARARSDHKEAATIEPEVEVMRKEIQKGRSVNSYSFICFLPDTTAANSIPLHVNYLIVFSCVSNIVFYCS